jgi:hypothetical protein
MDAKQIGQMTEHAQSVAMQAVNMQSDPAAKQKLAEAIVSLAKCAEAIRR